MEKPEVLKPRAISSVTIALIAIIILIIAIGAYYIMKLRRENSSLAPATTSLQTQAPTASETNENLQTATDEESNAGQVAQEATETEATAETSQSAVDFNYELKQLDTHVNSTSLDDYDDAEASDAQFGL